MKRRNIIYIVVCVLFCFVCLACSDETENAFAPTETGLILQINVGQNTFTRADGTTNSSAESAWDNVIHYLDVFIFDSTTGDLVPNCYFHFGDGTNNIVDPVCLISGNWKNRFHDYETCDVYVVANLHIHSSGDNTASETLKDIENLSELQQLTDEYQNIYQPVSPDSKKPFTIILFIIVLLLIGYGGYYMYSSSILNNTVTIGGSNTAVNTPVPATVVEPEPAVTFAGDNTSDNSSYFNYYGTSIYADNNTDNLTINTNDNTTEPAYIDPLFAQTIPTPVVLSPEKVKVKFSENCWFKYSTDKGEENEVNARRGTEIEIEFDKTFRIEIGNAVAVSMEYNGQEYSNFGNRNVVRILNYEAQDGKLELLRR